MLRTIYSNSIEDSKSLNKNLLQLGYFIYGKEDLMVSNQCFIASSLGYDHKKCFACLKNKYELIDEFDEYLDFNLAKELRKEATAQENRLWYAFLSNYSVRFQRQKVIGAFIADFYCHRARLVIELDGSQHYEDENAKHDAVRTAFLEGYGLTVIRIPNNEVSRNFRGVCEYIDAAVRQSPSQKSKDF